MHNVYLDQTFNNKFVKVIYIIYILLHNYLYQNIEKISIITNLY